MYRTRVFHCYADLSESVGMHIDFYFFSEKVCEYKTVLSHEKVFHVPRQLYYYTHVKVITITFTDT